MDRDYRGFRGDSFVAILSRNKELIAQAPVYALEQIYKESRDAMPFEFTPIILNALLCNKGMPQWICDELLTHDCIGVRERVADYLATK